MSLEGLKIRIKIHEGYRDTVYEDSLGKATIGYGHLLTYKDNFEPNKKYPKEMLDELFESDFQEAVNNAEYFCKSNALVINETAKHVIIEMVFQLGIGNVNKFKNMIKALQEQDYKKHIEGLATASSEYERIKAKFNNYNAYIEYMRSFLSCQKHLN